MERDDRLLFFFALENALLKHKGEAFEEFFGQVGTALWESDFELWSPQGRFGDMKCDGYRISEKTVFQCYAPERFQASKVVRKIQADFVGARDNFGPRMRKWVLVHNQRKGLPVDANRTIAILRDAHPGISIEAWSPDDLTQKIVQLPDNKLSALFPTLIEGHRFSDVIQTELERLFAENASLHEIVTCNPQQVNRLALDDALDGLGDADREIRRRLLGYSRWFDPAEKAMIIEKLIALGFAQVTVEANAELLHEAGLIRVTEGHYLPLDGEVCQEAAESLMDEFLRELED